jgi:FADH2 O2-dependent halogenase
MVADHPFDCDCSALHQLIDEGWMWQLRFDNGITSAGFAIDAVASPFNREVSAETEWKQLLARYPSLSKQFANSRLVAPEAGLQTTSRMQRLATQIAGGNWALLPSSAGFVDPLHSTGIAHTLCGIERLTHILAEHWQKPTLTEQLASYGRLVRLEFELIDLLVHGCYASRKNFRVFTSFAMLYFAAATTYERRRLNDGVREGFLCADDAQYVAVVKSIWSQLPTHSEVNSMDTHHFEQEVARRLQPYNHAGLCDPAARNMYARTALPVDRQIIERSFNGKPQASLTPDDPTSPAACR